MNSVRQRFEQRKTQGRAQGRGRRKLAARSQGKHRGGNQSLRWPPHGSCRRRPLVPLLLLPLLLYSLHRDVGSLVCQSERSKSSRRTLSSCYSQLRNSSRRRRSREEESAIRRTTRILRQKGYCSRISRTTKIRRVSDDNRKRLQAEYLRLTCSTSQWTISRQAQTRITPTVSLADPGRREARLLTGAYSNATAWIAWFLSTKGNEYFCEVDEEYSLARFNLTGLNGEVHHYAQALDMITDNLGACKRCPELSPRIPEADSLAQKRNRQTRFANR